MTTISPRRRHSHVGIRSLRVAGALLLVLLLVGVVLVWRGRAEGVLWYLLRPVFIARDAIDSSEITRLRTELMQTQALVADRNLLHAENLELKNRLNRNAERSTLLAAIIVRPPATPYDTLILDVGYEDGVREGQLVSAGGSTLIGIVSAVYAHTTRVDLFSSPGRTWAAQIRLSAQSGALVPVEIAGQGGGAMSAQVPTATRVKVGDTVLFPGIALGYAADVVAVHAPQGQSFETVYLHLPVSPASLRHVEVWTQSYAQ